MLNFIYAAVSTSILLVVVIFIAYSLAILIFSVTFVVKFI